MSFTSTASPFGRRLREARLRAGIAQDKLGVMIGLDETVASARMSRYESGIHAAPYELAIKLAEVLNVSPTYFYCEDDLVPIVLAWGRLTKQERTELNQIIEERFPKSLG